MAMTTAPRSWAPRTAPLKRRTTRCLRPRLDFRADVRRVALCTDSYRCIRYCAQTRVGELEASSKDTQCTGKAKLRPREALQALLRSEHRSVLRMLPTCPVCLQEALHRLCPDYATEINSPLRHVRTRVYFTSESHMHSLINVLRFCTLGAAVIAAS